MGICVRNYLICIANYPHCVCLGLSQQSHARLAASGHRAPASALPAVHSLSNSPAAWCPLPTPHAGAGAAVYTCFQLTGQANAFALPAGRCPAQGSDAGTNSTYLYQAIPLQMERCLIGESKRQRADSWRPKAAGQGTGTQWVEVGSDGQ